MVVHDRLVPPAILELARREAEILEVGKTAFGPSWKQDDINALIVGHALKGRTVVRLKGGDPAVFGRLDEEVEALEAAGVPYGVVPGVTSASAAAAAIGRSLTRRGRNSSFRVLTGHDVNGFAEQDWRELAVDDELRGVSDSVFGPQVQREFRNMTRKLRRSLRS